MSISHYQLQAFLEEHQGKGLAAEVEELEDGRSCVHLSNQAGEVVHWMESDSSCPVLIEQLADMGYLCPSSSMVEQRVYTP